jgi:transposase
MSKDFIKYEGFPAQKILFLKGMSVDFTQVEDNKTIIINLSRAKKFKKSFCSQCGRQAPREKRVKRKIRDLPMFGKDVYLDCELFVVKCPDCGYKRERLDLVDKCSRITARFESLIFKIVAMSTVKDAADLYDLSWDTVKNIDKKYLSAKFSEIDYGNLEYISIDEIANKKGHDYLTTVMNSDSGKVIWVGEGRKEEDIDKFFDTLNKEEKARIRAVSIDMWPAYITR